MEAGRTGGESDDDRNIDRPGLQIVGDERRLRWALGNIIDNAIKYTPPGGKISLEIKDEEDGYARLRVRDNGVGIAADELPNVFTRFYRGDPVSVTGRALRVPGTGQGLTIARQIIETHDGRIYLRSSPGVGTAVYFTLPMAVYEHQVIWSTWTKPKPKRCRWAAAKSVRAPERMFTLAGKDVNLQGEPVMRSPFCFASG